MQLFAILLWSVRSDQPAILFWLLLDQIQAKGSPSAEIISVKPMKIVLLDNVAAYSISPSFVCVRRLPPFVTCTCFYDTINWDWSRWTVGRCMWHPSTTHSTPLGTHVCWPYTLSLFPFQLHTLNGSQNRNEDWICGHTNAAHGCHLIVISHFTGLTHSSLSVCLSCRSKCALGDKPLASQHCPGTTALLCKTKLT